MASDVQTWCLGAGTLLLAVGLANAGSVAYGSRPLQRALDLVVFAAWLWAVWGTSRLVLVGLWSFAGARAWGLVPLALGLVLLAASAFQVLAGRTDPYRSHAALSLTLWGLMFGGLGLLVGVGHSMERASASDVRRVVWAAGAPKGDWVWVAGPVRWGQYWAAFLYQPSTGRSVSLGEGGKTVPLAFSRDGRHAALVERTSFQPEGSWDEARTRVVDLDAPTPILRTLSAYLYSHEPPTLALSREADCLLVIQASGLTLYTLSSGEQDFGFAYYVRDPRTGGRMDARWRSSLAFLEDGRFRAFLDSWGTTAVVTAGAHDRVVEARRVAGGCSGCTQGFLRSNDAGERLLQGSKVVTALWKSPHAPPGWLVTLHDGADAEELATLTEGARSVDADFLSDGRIALVEVREADAVLRLLAAGGEEGRRIELGPASFVLLAGEPDPGRLFVGLRDASGREAVAVVDLETGSVSREPGLFPITPRQLLSESPRPDRPAHGSAAARVFISDRGALVRLDPKTRARTVVLGPGKR